jgi:LPS-assembly protein
VALSLALAGGAALAQEPAPPAKPEQPSGLRALARIGGAGGAAPSAAAQEIDEIAKGVYRLRGYADVEAGGIRLQADEILYDSNAGTAEASGNVVLIQGDGALTAGRLVMNLETGEATLWDASGYTPPNYQFRAARVERVSAEVFWIYDAVFTSCTQPVPYWSFRVKRARVRLEHYAKLRGAAFRAGKVPVVWLPWMLWPVKQERASGLLMPQFGQSAERGFFIGTATYWAMRRNMDATFYVDWYSLADFAGGLEYRYIPSQSGKGRFVGYLLPHDVDPQRSRRYFYHYDADQPFASGWRLLADVNQVSDSDFYRDFERDLNVATRPNAFSTLYGTRSWSYYTLDLRVERNEQFFSSGAEVLQERLPEVELRTKSRRLGDTPLYLSFLGSANGLRRQETGLDADYRRYDLGATLSAQLTPAPWIDLTPSLSVRDTYWTQQEDAAAPDGVADEGLNRPLYSLGLNILGPKAFRVWNPEPGSPGSRWKSTIEPEVRYTYIPAFDETSEILLYDEVDAVPTDLNTLTYALTSRLLRRRPAAGEEEGEYESAQEMASVSVVQSVAFNRDLSVSGTLGEQSSFGPVSFLGHYNPTRAVSADLRLDWDVLFREVRAVSASASATSPRWGRASLSYYLNRGLEAGASDSGTLRLGGGTAVFRKRFSFDLDLAYDLRLDQIQSQRYRVGYDTQCCGFSIEYLRNEFSGLIDPDEQIRFVISLAGVGTFLDLNSRLN